MSGSRNDTALPAAFQTPSIDSYSESGLRPDSIRGDIEFRNIHFNYPSRSDVKVRSPDTSSRS